MWGLYILWSVCPGFGVQLVYHISGLILGDLIIFNIIILILLIILFSLFYTEYLYPKNYLIIFNLKTKNYKGKFCCSHATLGYTELLINFFRKNNQAKLCKYQFLTNYYSIKLKST